MPTDYIDELMAYWETTHPAVPKAAYAVAVRLIRSGRYIEESMSRAAQQFGLSGRGDYEVLAAVARSEPDGVRPADVALVAMVTSAGVTGRLDRLETSGWIERRRNPDDRRSVLLHVTPEGARIASATAGASMATANRLFDGVAGETLSSVQEAIRALFSTETTASSSDPTRPF